MSNTDLQSVELGGRRLLVGAVGDEVQLGCTSAGPVQFSFFSIGQISAESVLRAKGGDHIDARRDERVDEVGESCGCSGWRPCGWTRPRRAAFEEGQVGVHPGVRRLPWAGTTTQDVSIRARKNGRRRMWAK